MENNDSVTKAMIVIAALSCCKNINIFSEHIKWQLNAYTNWNLFLIIVRYILSYRDWDPFLCVNSIGIYFGFRTAFTQGLDDNIRKKLNGLGLKLTRPEFLLGDFCVHTLPMILMIYIMVSQKRKIKPVHITYAITITTLFVFRQVGCMDASDIYVPHPWKRAWIAVLTSMLSSPHIVNAMIQKDKKKIVLLLFILSMPYLTTRLDSGLKKKYDFEYILKKKSCHDVKGVARIASEPILNYVSTQLESSP